MNNYQTYEIKQYAYIYSVPFSARVGTVQCVGDDS